MGAVNEALLGGEQVLESPTTAPEPNLDLDDAAREERDNDHNCGDGYDEALGESRDRVGTFGHHLGDEDDGGGADFTGGVL